MGFAYWLKRLFRRRTGGSVLCDVCRTEIPASDFERGLSVIIARQRFCRGCVEHVMKRASHRRGDPAAPAPRVDLEASSTAHGRIF